VNYLKSYLYVGGMPEVVLQFAKGQDYLAAREVQERILDAYAQDFSKHVPVEQIQRLNQIWHSIPVQLAKENKKFVYKELKPGARSKDYEIALEWLASCGLVYRVGKVSKPALPLSAYGDGSFKLYLFDVGLLSALSGLTTQVLLEGATLFTEYKGALSEQFVLQELKTIPRLPVAYWKSDSGLAEVDFLVQSGAEIFPIEVKSSINLKAKSLKSYMDKFKPSRAFRFSLATYKVTDSLVDAPLYGAARVLR
jgi:predicted AAA+ superfamily ATPase